MREKASGVSSASSSFMYAVRSIRNFSKSAVETVGAGKFAGTDPTSGSGGRVVTLSVSGGVASSADAPKSKEKLPNSVVSKAVGSSAERVSFLKGLDSSAESSQDFRPGL